MKNKEGKKETGFCKKCNKELPIGYKHKYCENCRTKKAEEVKNGIKVGGSIVIGAVALVVAITKGTDGEA